MDSILSIPARILVRTMSSLVLLDANLNLRVTYAVIALLAIVSAAVIYIFDPRVPGLYPVCPFFGFTGYHCVGCGTLRALHSILHADIAGALGYNALAVMVFPFIAYSYISGASRAFVGRSLPGVFIRHQWIWTLLAVVIAFWIIRNLPVHPFSVLAP